MRKIAEYDDGMEVWQQALPGTPLAYLVRSKEMELACYPWRGEALAFATGYQMALRLHEARRLVI